ncbi:MAG: cell division protein ZapA [Treponemataceae bacterium]|nr:cell division protein ZapA [Treponemataceae bacterium]
MGTLQIEALGTSFTIQAKEDSEYLKELLEHYQNTVKKIEKTTGLKENLKISILAGIFIADEYLKEHEKLLKTNPDLAKVDMNKVEEMTLGMINSLDKIL